MFYELECVIGVCMGGKPASGCVVQEQFAEIGGECLGDAEWPRDVSPIPVYARMVADDVVLLPVDPQHNTLIRADAKLPLLKEIAEMARELVHFTHMMEHPTAHYWPQHEQFNNYHPTDDEIKQAKERIVARMSQLLYAYFGREGLGYGWEMEMWRRLKEIARRESMNQASYDWWKKQDVGVQQKNIFDGKYLYGQNYKQQTTRITDIQSS